MNSLPTKDEFAAQLNTNFEAREETGKLFEMTLVEVKSVISNKFQECFALLFCTLAEDVAAQQQSFRLKHSILGEMELFLVPVKKNENNLFFEAVFNKLIA